MKRLSILFAAVAAFVGVNAYSQEKIAIDQLPYIQNLGETEVTIIWRTNLESTGWVEIAPDDGTNFYADLRPQYYDSQLGFKKVCKLHRVTVPGLEPGKTYRYRVISQEAAASDNGKVVYGDYASTKANNSGVYVFTTKKDKEITRFAIINDIHGDSAKIYSLFSQVDPADLDFVVGNGDLVSALHTEDMLSEKFLNYASDIFAARIPLYAARGNHETRGRCALEFLDYFPVTDNGQTYYTFTYGDTFFIVADGGEDKPDTDIEYYGLGDFDSFREAEVAWLESVIESEEYKAASKHVAFIHMPPVGEALWHGPGEVRRLFLPIFNKADLDVMFCGHTHNYRYWEPGEDGNEFPIVVNDNDTIVEVEISPKGISADVIDREGKTVKAFHFK